MQETGVQVGQTLLGKYRVERVLGQGGMGVVVAARHTQLNELFAIKMMLPAAFAHPDALVRFLREAQACARLKGEHVARVHDVGSLENGAPYMLMEHLTGEDLSHVLQVRGALSIEEAALYVYQACEAIAEAHATGIIHRDLKPSNLFLTHRPNGTPCVKVLDFGISKDLDPANRVGSNLTKTGVCMGSPVYMSPEQMANAKATDARSDIWSLGVILYELVTNSVPFDAELMTELVTKVLTEQARPPSQTRPGIAPSFEGVVMRCLDKQPKNRYQSVHELMAALRPFVPRNSQEPLWTHDTLVAGMRHTSSDWSNTGNVTATKNKSKKPLLAALAVLCIGAVLGVAMVASKTNADKPAVGVETAAMPRPTPTVRPDEPASKDPASPPPQPTAATVEPLAPIATTMTATTNGQQTSTTRGPTNGPLPTSKTAGTPTSNRPPSKDGVILVPR